MRLDTSATVAVQMPMTEERREALERLFARIGDINSLPAAAERVLCITNSENADADELCEAVQSDPVLVARILRRLNSSYYALSQKISDLKTAIGLLGLREIRNMALTVFISRSFDGDAVYGTYNREDLWAHSVGVAVASRLVARVCGLSGCEEAYIAGLLHDIGLILLDQTLRRHFQKLIDSINEQTPTYVTESRIFAFDHAMLGGFVARRWNFPDSVADAIAYHHQPQSYEGQHKELVNVVAVANYLCSRAGVTSLGVHNCPPPPDEIYRGLGLDQVTLAIIWEELDGALERASSLATAN